MAVLAACSSSELPADSSSINPTVARPGGPLLDVVDATGWINTEPISIQQLASEQKVVLVDFWTYTCVNCVRTFPFLQDWHEKYADRGLVILGVHAPEFAFEEEYENVLRATEQHNITWPVVMDNNFRTWERFGNRFWPAKYLVGTDGKLRYTHFGEGRYVETEEMIREALVEAGHDVSDIAVGEVERPPIDPEANRLTREIYGGYVRSYSPGGEYAGQDEYYNGPDRTEEYNGEGIRYSPNYFYLHGLWRNESEAIVHARNTEDYEDYLALRFTARSVNVVMDPQGPESFDVVVEIDDRPLTPEEAGADIWFDDQGRSMFTVTMGDLYRLVELPVFGEHVLKLRTNSDSFAVFAFTFGNYQSGL